MQEGSRNKNKFRNFILVYIAMVTIAIILFWGFGQTYLSPDKENALIRFSIDRNQGVLQIASNLMKEGLINSKLVFVVYSILSGHFSEFKPGVYILSDSINMRNIIEMLTKGPEDVEIIFYPGMTMNEMDRLLAKKGLIKEGEFSGLSVEEFKDKFEFLRNAKSLEGYLIPDTYRFHPDFNAEMIAEVMLNNFWEKAGDILKDRDDIDKIIRIASLIEKEVAKKDDRKLVASVIYNRLNINMPLQIDATIIYGKCNGVFVGCELTREDFKEDGPYNTYTRRGLPPTSISNPILSSIEAAVNPAKTNFFYYLSDRRTGETFFSRTFEEHDSKRAIYLGI